MEIKNITVRHCSTGSFSHRACDGWKHIKELPYLSLVQATEGHYSLGLDGGAQREMAEGECFIAPSLARQEITHHVNAQSRGMSARWVFMDVVINDHIPFDTAFSLPVFPDGALSAAIGDILDRLLASNDIIDKKIECYALLKLLMPHAAERAGRDARIDGAVNYIQKHFREPLTVGQIAVACSMSEPNLYRLFKREMGASPMEYCHSLRLSHAFMLLENSSYGIEEIGALCGVEDPFYFSKMFKKKTGLSPTEYRKKLKRL